MKSYKKQQGIVLFLALIFLVMMTLFAVSSINMSTVNLRIVGNMQAVKSLDADAQTAIEEIISGMNSFGPVPAGATITGEIGTVNVAPPVCIDSQVASGYSAVVTNIIPEDNVWEVTATVDDDLTGATSSIHQGVEIRMLAGNCP